MEGVELTKKPKSPIVIGGFPGYGLVGTIATDFLIKHLNAKPIGRINVEGVAPLIALHESKIIGPLGVYYAEKQNIVIVHALSLVTGIEWDVAKAINKLCKDLNAKELICLEGVASQDAKLETFYYSTKNASKFEKIGLKQLKEGLVMGVTAALLLESEGASSCIFVESHSGYADSEAAAELIKVLDDYIGLDVDYKPLIEAAKKFESNMRLLMEKSQQKGNPTSQQQKEELAYLG